ncbi:hypothetical protein [Streptomyces sp. NPDC101249]|uniref:hypothetical protein n=1 Tax=Streptomyces sp. NPDC101249 TaxID=3366140 RepID=UPI00381DCA24
MLDVALLSVGCTWLFKKARRVAARADQHIDETLDAAVDRLFQLVSAKPEAAPLLARLEQEAEDGLTEPSPRTRRRLEDALAQDAEDDTDFATDLERAIKAIRDAENGSAAGVQANSGGAAAQQMNIQADNSGVAAAVINGGVRMTVNPSQPGAAQG